MRIPEIGPGIAVGIGATNYREIFLAPTGEPIGPEVRFPTPHDPDEFNAALARTMLYASEQGVGWGIVGNPGPAETIISNDGVYSSRMRVTNIKGLDMPKGFDPVSEMSRVEPAFGRLVDAGFNLSVANDGNMAVLAASCLYADGLLGQQFDVVGSGIVGTGVGGALARRDPRFPALGVFHPDPGLWEVGHTLRSPFEFGDTKERALAGPAIANRFHLSADVLAPDDSYWEEFTGGVGSLALDLALLGGAELVVFSGGVASGRFDAYGSQLKAFMEDFRHSDNPMADRVPIIKIAPEKVEGVSFELHGAHGIVRSQLVQHEIDKLIAASE